MTIREFTARCAALGWRGSYGEYSGTWHAWCGSRMLQARTAAALLALIAELG